MFILVMIITLVADCYDRDRWLAMEAALGKNAHIIKSIKLKGPKFPKLDTALSIWVWDVLDHGGVPSWSLIRSKARELMPLLGITED